MAVWVGVMNSAVPPGLTGPCERFMRLNVKSSLLFAALAGCYLQSSPLSLQADCECTPQKQHNVVIVAMFDLIFWSIHLTVFKSVSNRKTFFESGKLSTFCFIYKNILMTFYLY